MDPIDHIKTVHDLFIYLLGEKNITTTADAVYRKARKARFAFFTHYLLSDKTSYASAINLNFSSA
jgi:hypothetical protein